MLRRDRMRELVDVADRDLKRAQVSFTSLRRRCASSCTLPPCPFLALPCPAPHSSRHSRARTRAPSALSVASAVRLVGTRTPTQAKAGHGE